MDELVLVEIARQVHQVDKAFINARIGMIEKVTQWDESLYLNWRNHLLAKKAREKKLVARVHGDRRDDYMKLRYHFSEKKYEKPENTGFPRTSSMHSMHSMHSSASSNSLYSDGQSTDDSPPSSPVSRREITPIKERRSQSLGTTTLPAPDPHLIKSFQLTPKLNNPATPQKCEPTTPTRPDHSDYTFTGMHHIFAETTHPITAIEYGVNDNDVLAFGSQEGYIYVCAALKNPRVIHNLKGHSSAITSLRWVGGNEHLISTSLDSVRVWNRRTGLAIKILKESGIASCLHPVDNSVVFVSDNKSYIKAININTGKSVLKVKALSTIFCLQFDTLGQYLFAGDEKGYVEVFRYVKESGALQLLTKTAISSRPIASLSFKSIYTNQQFCPSIIVNCRDNTVKMFIMKNVPNPGTLVLTREFPLKNNKDVIRSRWCPSADSPCFVTGSESTGIYFFDIKRKKEKPVNTLMGHSSSVTNLSWCTDESFLVSADTSGMVILWTRKK